MVFARRQARRNLAVGMAIGSSRGRRKAESANAAPAPAPAANPAPQPSTSADDIPAQLRKLKSLVDEGVLTEDEFAAKKAKLLGI